MKAYCLCAEWCNICRSFRPGFEQLRQDGFDIEWVDIEDQPEWTDDIELETFPYLVIKVGDKTVFEGPVEPRPAHVARLLENWSDESSS